MTGKKIILSFIMIFNVFTLFGQSRPNVIFIMADDLGYGDPGVYGQRFIKTPNLDKLAAMGMRFTQFYSGTTVCAPSRASLMSGMHTGHTSVRGNYEIQPEGQFPIPDSTITLAELFKSAGYRTGAFGKWGLGFPGSEGDPVNQGFDEFFGYNCQRESHNYYPGHLWENKTKIQLDNSITDQSAYAPDLIQERALRFINNNKDNPFFLYLPYTLPHAALQVSNSDTMFSYYKELFQEKQKPIPAAWNGKGYQPQAYPLAAYATMVTALDHYVGAVMTTVEELGLEKNTLIIFTSDNGPHREGGNDPEFFNSNAGFRGVKRDLFEGGIRVPLIAAWPGKIAPATISDHISAAYDFLATFTELTNQTADDQDGISMLPVLLSEDNQPEHEFLYWEFIENGGSQAVRMGNWKGVRLNVKQDRNAPLLLFDLQKDPAEIKDISADFPEIVKKIKRIMDEQHVENENFPLMSALGK